MLAALTVLAAAGAARAQNAAVTISVDASRDRRPINPEIYGVAHASGAELADLNVPLNRWGGNNTSRYNWQLNADNRGNDETTNHPFRLHPPKNGTVFRIIHYPPDKIRLAALAKEQAMPDDSGRNAATDRDNPRHPGFHKTSTIDYAIVLSGEIYALMDQGEVLLKAGDVLIQRGTSHAWSNRTEEPCCVAFVLIDADPV